MQLPGVGCRAWHGSAFLPQRHPLCRKPGVCSPARIFPPCPSGGPSPSADNEGPHANGSGWRSRGTQKPSRARRTGEGGTRTPVCGLPRSIHCHPHLSPAIHAATGERYHDGPFFFIIIIIIIIYLLRFVIIKIYHKKSCGLFVHLHSGCWFHSGAGTEAGMRPAVHGGRCGERKTESEGVKKSRKTQ